MSDRANSTSRIEVGPDLIDQTPEFMRDSGLTGRAFIFSDSSVFSLHGNRLLQAFERAGIEARSSVLPAGESTKSLESAFAAYDWLVSRKAERRDNVIALGGGVIGDLAGFVAATYLRGLPFVQAPTTLLAQVDSAIGGKVAVNHPSGKNLVGAFYQPRLTVVDPTLLLTLGGRDLASGWAEVIKTAFILDEEMLETLESGASRLAPNLSIQANQRVPGGETLDLDLASRVIRRSIDHKVAVVEEDPTEKGRRVILNYGHTLAHSLEATAGYGAFRHGEAVSIGMMGAALISQALGLLTESVVQRQERCLRAYGLPIRMNERIDTVPETDALLAAMSLDKKVDRGSIRWVLLEGIGRTVVRQDVPIPVVRSAIEALR